jgi:hypothetical protein
MSIGIGIVNGSSTRIAYRGYARTSDLGAAGNVLVAHLANLGAALVQPGYMDMHDHRAVRYAGPRSIRGEQIE